MKDIKIIYSIRMLFFREGYNLKESMPEKYQELIEEWRKFKNEMKVKIPGEYIWGE